MIVDLHRDFPRDHYCLVSVVLVHDRCRITTSGNLSQPLSSLGLAGVEDDVDRGVELVEPVPLDQLEQRSQARVAGTDLGPDVACRGVR